MLSRLSSLDEYARCLAEVRIPMSPVVNAITRHHAIDWQVARIDLLDDELSGNKLFKLLPFLLRARAEGRRRLLSFGGGHSNHLHALALAGKRFGFGVVAIVRGYATQPETPTLADIRALGAQILFADRAMYARRYDADYLQQLAHEFPDALVIPEGGAGEEGIAGAQYLGRLLATQLGGRPCTVALATGTGTTFLGLLSAGVWGERHHLAGFAALGNARELREKATACLVSRQPLPSWEVTDDFCFGGFARMTSELASFIRVFEKEQSMPLDPVYTAKLCYAIQHQIGSGRFHRGSSIVMLHTGGLQGRRGMQARLAAHYPEECRGYRINHA